MYDFCALGRRLAEKHGLIAIPTPYETDYFLIKDTSFIWSEVLRTFDHYDYIVYFNTPEKVTYKPKNNPDTYEYCYGFNESKFGRIVGIENWPVNNAFKQEHFKKYPEIDIEDCLDKMLVSARKELNKLILKTKKSEIKSAGSKYIL